MVGKDQEWQIDTNLEQQTQATSVESTESGVSAGLRPWKGQSNLHDHRHHLKSMHGILNIFGWGFLLPTGAIIARNFRKSPLKCDEWYPLHTYCQSSGYIVGTVGWGIGIWLGNSSKQHTLKAHRILGIIIFSFATLQMMDKIKSSRSGGLSSRRRRTLYVGNLPRDVRTKEVEDLFYKYGRIAHIDLKIRPRGPCFAFIKFEKARDAAVAISGRDRYNFGGYPLRVTQYNPRNKILPISDVNQRRSLRRGLRSKSHRKTSGNSSEQLESAAAPENMKEKPSRLGLDEVKHICDTMGSLYLA
ncbi:hypothetical protein CCACVL1_15370 [Corchorus capsularis]|uniref:RRM domain-containing protein n=1 Tax=Corchorus capsularis TaxID=210143 RepID=A0A1R3I331_COCAP|nr:hypothetical protein CCACVL1_15370 [Corchorus capsularis]